MATAPMIAEPRRIPRQTGPAPSHSTASRAFRATIETDPAKLRRVFSREQLVADRILAASRTAWAAWHEVEAYKKEHGFCTAGLTCVRKAIHGDACEHHYQCRENGVKLAGPRYQSEYGRLRKSEMDAERERERQRKDRHKGSRRRHAA